MPALQASHPLPAPVEGVPDGRLMVALALLLLQLLAMALNQTGARWAALATLLATSLLLVFGARRHRIRDRACTGCPPLAWICPHCLLQMLRPVGQHELHAAVWPAHPHGRGAGHADAGPGHHGGGPPCCCWPGPGGWATRAGATPRSAPANGADWHGYFWLACWCISWPVRLSPRATGGWRSQMNARTQRP